MPASYIHQLFHNTYYISAIFLHAPCQVHLQIKWKYHSTIKFTFYFILHAWFNSRNFVCHIELQPLLLLKEVLPISLNTLVNGCYLLPKVGTEKSTRRLVPFIVKQSLRIIVAFMVCILYLTFSLPTTFRYIWWPLGGVVDTWHSYFPASLWFSSRILSCQKCVMGTWWAENLWSEV